MELLNLILGANGQENINSIIGPCVVDGKTKIAISEKIKEHAKYLKEKEEEFYDAEMLSIPIIVRIFKRGGNGDNCSSDELIKFILKEKNSFYEKYGEKANEIGADIEAEFCDYASCFFTDSTWEELK